MLLLHFIKIYQLLTNQRNRSFKPFDSGKENGGTSGQMPGRRVQEQGQVPSGPGRDHVV